MQRKLIALVALLALHAVARADGVRSINPDDEPLPCTTPMPLAEVCGCLAKAHYGKTCGPIGPEEVKGARLFRVTEDEGVASVVFLAADGPGGWRLILGVDWEQQRHVHNNMDLHPSAQTELKVAASRVYRLEYRYRSSECPRDQDWCDESDDTWALLCVLDGSKGAPICSAKSRLRCDHWQEADPPKKRARQQGRAELSVAADGKLTRKVTRRAACIDEPAPHSLF